MSSFRLPAADARVQPRFAGLATLLRAPYQPDPAGLDIALVGVPSEFTVFRNGTRWGPGQIREASRVIRPLNSETRIDPFKVRSVADVGDVPVNPLSLSDTNSRIQSRFEELRQMGVRALAVGGDHGVSLPVLRALGPDGPLGLLHIDAHHDTHDELYGVRDNHATLIRRVIEEGIVDPTRTVSLGLRGSLYHDQELDWSEEQRITVISPGELARRGTTRAIADMLAIFGDRPIYITLDIDGLDPLEAPGTGVPEPGGLSFVDTRDVLRGMQGHEIVGADLVEVSPTLDQGGRTAMLAAHLLFEQLCLLAQSP